MNKGIGYSDEITAPAEEPYCFPGDSEIQFANGVDIAYRRRYIGKLAVIVTDSGKTIRATPNHPILSQDGWVAIGSLKEGDYVAEIADKVVDRVMPEMDEDCRNPSIAQIFGSLDEMGKISRVAGGSNQFHGDGTEEYVDIVRADRPLSFGINAPLSESGNQFDFSETNLGGSVIGSFDLLFDSSAGSAPRIVCSDNVSRLFIGSSVAEHDLIELPKSSNGESSISNGSINHSPGNSEFFSNIKNAFPCGMTLAEFHAIQGDFMCRVRSGEILDPVLMQVSDRNPEVASDGFNSQAFRAKVGKIVRVDWIDFDSHVYNLQTKDGWYVADGIIAHNCSCAAIYLSSLRDLPESMLTSKGREALKNL